MHIRYFLFIIEINFVTGFLNLPINGGVQFLRCERVIDRTEGTLAKDKIFYDFIFNSIKTFDSYEIQTHKIDRNSNNSDIQTSKCLSDSSREIKCGVIKSSIYQDIKHSNGFVEVMIRILGMNDSKSSIILQNRHKFLLCELRSCSNTKDIVEFSRNIEWNPRTKKYDIPLQNILVSTKNLYDQLMFQVYFSNQTDTLILETRNLTKIDNNSEEILSGNLKDKCIASFDKVCIATKWTYCLNNNTSLWQVQKRCLPFIYTGYFPKYQVHCSSEKDVKLIIVMADSTKKSTFYDFKVKTKWNQNSKSFTTKNLTIALNQQTKYAEVSLCDGCMCTSSVSVTCNVMMSTKAPPQNRTGIISGTVIAIVFVIVVVVVIIWRKKNNANKYQDNIDITELPQPLNSYSDPEILKDRHIPHKYLDVATQEEYELNEQGKKEGFKMSSNNA